jgi:hypothetical protein
MTKAVARKPPAKSPRPEKKVSARALKKRPAAPSAAVVAARLKNRVSLWSSLSPAQQAKLLAYDGPEASGEPVTRRRR